MLRGHSLRLIPALAFLLMLPAAAPAQSVAAYSLDDITEFVKGGLTATSILGRVRSSCISFRLTQSVSEKLRSAGANDALIDGLRNVCYKSDSKSGGDTGDRNTTRDVQRVTPRPPRRDPVTPVRKVVTPPVQPTVYTPPLTTTVNNGAIDWDFRSNHALSSGHFNNCDYSYSPSGYTIRVLEYGSSCLDGSSQEWEPNIRVSTRATPVSGAPGFTYGLRFGINDDPAVGYYAFEVSSYGHFELSRYRNNKWEVVFPWQTGTGINANGPNTITADIHGATVKFTINGIEQYTYQAPMPIRGRAGFGIIGFDKEGPFPAITFESFSVSGEKGTGTTTTTTVTPSTGTTVGPFVDYDFRSSQPLTSGRYGKCQYDYSSAGYTVSVAEFGSTCIDGPLGDQPANIRVSTTGVGLRGNTGYTYGLRLGYTSDSTVGYYAFEVSEGGSFQLSRHRMNHWEVLIPWQRLSAINAASSGVPNTLTAEVRGPALTLYVNNTQVGTYQAPYPVVGSAGFGIIGYEQSGVPPAVAFTRFSIAPLSGGTPATTTTTTTTTGATPLVDYDFLSSRPLSTGLYGRCQYDYTSQGYIITLADTAGYICLDGPTTMQPTNVRISATGLPLRPGSGYMYGVRFGHKTQPSVSYYLYELNESNEVKLSQYNGQWITLLPWRAVSNANAAGSGIPNVMSVEVRGSSVTLYLNGAQVGTYQAPETITGQAGFGITGFRTSAPSIAYTRFTVTPIY